VRPYVRTLVVLFSFVLNAAFLGAFTYHRFFSDHRHDHAEGREAKPFLEQLGLTPDQREQFEAARDRFRERLGDLGQEIQAQQLQLMDLLDVEEPDRAALDNKRRAIAALQNQLQQAVLDHLLEEGAILDPDQRDKLFRLLREDILDGGKSSPPWMRSVESSPHEEH